MKRMLRTVALLVLWSGTAVAEEVVLEVGGLPVRGNLE